MKNSIVAYVGWLLILAAAIFYFYGIYLAIDLSWSKTSSEIAIPYPEVLSTTIGAIQALLLANLGIVLGISIANPNSGIARALNLQRNAPLNAPRPPLEIKDKIQLVAVLGYVAGLIACMITWIVNDFKTDGNNIVPLIAESGKMFLGVVLAYLTAVLSR